MDDMKPSHASRFMSALRGFSTNAVKKTERSVQQRYDAWTNYATSQGTPNDKTTHGFVVPNRWLADFELSTLYHHDDMAFRMVDAVPEMMFRKGILFDVGHPEANDLLGQKMDALEVENSFEDGVRWGRCYGGSAVFIGCDDGIAASLPLRPERAEDIDFLMTLDRRLIWPFRKYTTPGKNLGKTETYLITSGEQEASIIEVHESRLIIFPGAITGSREKRLLNGWDASILQRAYDTLRQFNVGWKAVETMMTDGNQSIFTMTALADILDAPGGGEDVLRERLKAINFFRSFINAIVLDADGGEKFERQQVSFSDIPQTLQMLMLRLSATVEIPVTILMGQSPAGMSATGQSDFQGFYDKIESKQKKIVTPRARYLVQTWLRTRAGQIATKKIPATARLTVKYPSLWTETPTEAATRRKLLIDGDGVLIDKTVITPAEVALQRLRAEGYDRELTLSEPGIEARERTVADELEAMSAVVEVDDNAIETDTTTDESSDVPDIKLAPTDIAVIVTVNEARASQKLPPMKGPDGDMSLLRYKAMQGAVIADVASAEAGSDPNAPKPAPSPSGFGAKPPFSGAHPAPSRTPDDVTQEPPLPFGQKKNEPGAEDDTEE